MAGLISRREIQYIPRPLEQSQYMKRIKKFNACPSNMCHLSVCLKNICSSQLFKNLDDSWLQSQTYDRGFRNFPEVELDGASISDSAYEDYYSASEAESTGSKADSSKFSKLGMVLKATEITKLPVSTKVKNKFAPEIYNAVEVELWLMWKLLEETEDGVRFAILSAIALRGNVVWLLTMTRDTEVFEKEPLTPSLYARSATEDTLTMTRDTEVFEKEPLTPSLYARSATEDTREIEEMISYGFPVHFTGDKDVFLENELLFSPAAVASAGSEFSFYDKFGNCVPDTTTYAKRYYLFSRYDEGILLDYNGWSDVTPESIAEYIAKLYVTFGFSYSNSCSIRELSPSIVSMDCLIDNDMGISSEVINSNEGTLFQQEKQSEPRIILDGFCGVGGNTIQFARFFDFVIAVDADENRVKMAVKNAEIYGVRDKIVFIHEDVVEWMKGRLRDPDSVIAAFLFRGVTYSVKKFDYIFLSPPWGPTYDSSRTVEHTFRLSDIIDVDIFLLLKLASRLSWNLCLYLPRTQSLVEIAMLALFFGFNFCEIEYLYKTKLSRSKVLVVYLQKHLVRCGVTENVLINASMVCEKDAALLLDSSDGAEWEEVMESNFPHCTADDCLHFLSSKNNTEEFLTFVNYDECIFSFQFFNNRFSPLRRFDFVQFKQKFVFQWSRHNVKPYLRKNLIEKYRSGFFKDFGSFARTTRLLKLKDDS